MIDKHTFGGSKASESLADILNNEHPQLISKVSKHYHKFTRMMYNFKIFQKSATGGTQVLHLMDLYKNDSLKSILSVEFPTNIHSHLRNVMLAQYGITMSKVRKIISEQRA